MPTPKLKTTSKRTITRLTDKATNSNAPDNPLRITGGVSHIITILSDFLRIKTDKIRFPLCVFDEFYFVKLINANNQNHIFKHFNYRLKGIFGYYSFDGKILYTDTDIEDYLKENYHPPYR